MYYKKTSEPVETLFSVWPRNPFNVHHVVSKSYNSHIYGISAQGDQ